MSCSYYFWKILYFFVHCILHLFGYVIPRGVRLLFRLLTCQPCRKACRDDYIVRQEDEVRVVHNRDTTEVVVDVFGLVDVKESRKEDRQYCCETREEEEKLRKKAAKKMLFYDRPLYNAHLSTIMGIKRPTEEVEYSREETHSWDGCPIALDWLYVEGCLPASVHHTSTICPTMRSEPILETAADSEHPGMVTLEEKSPKSGLSDYFSYLPRFFSSSSTDSDTGSSSCPDTVCGLPGVDQSWSDSATRRSFMSTKAKGVVVFVPGLSSTSQTSYVRRFVKALHAAHYHVCVVNTRGLSGPSVDVPFMINSAYTRDFRTVVRRFFSKDAITHRFGCALPVIGLGLSNGGATISKFLGEVGRDGEEPYLDAAITCDAPNDFVNVVEHMNRGTMQKCIYQPDMCNDVRGYILSHEEFRRMPNIDTDYLFKQGNIHRFSRVLHFDEHIFSKTSGYRSVHQYHMDASAVLWLPFTPIPTLVLASFDDPVIGRTVMPHRWREMCANNPRLVSVEVRQGGHLGFLQGPIDELRGRPDWMQEFVIQRMDAVCQYWRRVQQHPETSSGLMQLIPETWERYYTEMDHPMDRPTMLPTPAEHSFPVNSPYFTARTTKALPKECLYRPYFDAPCTDEMVSGEVEGPNEPPKVLGLRDLTRRLSQSLTVANVDEHVVPEEMQVFNEKGRSVSEVLQTAVRVPIFTNCDYYVDPRVYMVDTPEPGIV